MNTVALEEGVKTGLEEASLQASDSVLDQIQLPSGRHGLPPEFVEAHQRVRLLRAVCSICATVGYGSMTIAQITSKAGVSRRTFYKHFDGKQESFLAAYQMLLERMEAKVAKACSAAGPVWHDRVVAGLRVLLDELVGDPDAAHVLFVDALSAGPTVLLCRQETLRRHSGAIPIPSGVPAGVAETVAGGVVEMIYHTILEGRLAGLPEMYGELLYCVLVPFLGPAEAMAVCGRVSALTNSSS